MKKRIVSLGLALVMCFVCTVSAFAAGAGNTETLYLDDGTVITITVLPDEKFPVSRTGESFSSTATTIKKSLRYNCIPADGNYCEINVSSPTYADEHAGIKVEMSFISSNGTIAKSNEQTIYVGQRVYLTISNNNGTGLNCTAITTVQAVSGNAEYFYSVDQSWK